MRVFNYTLLILCFVCMGQEYYILKNQIRSDESTYTMGSVKPTPRHTPECIYIEGSEKHGWAIYMGTVTANVDPEYLRRALSRAQRER